MCYTEPMRPKSHPNRLEPILWGLIALLLTACAVPADPVDPATPSAANADVTFVRAEQTSPDTWTFSVTVEHPDTGWEDYANGWDVVLPPGEVVYPAPGDPFTRLLLHPHVEEQPFTRSAPGIVIPADVTIVTVRAHDLVDGWGGQTITVDLNQPAGEGFEVTR